MQPSVFLIILTWNQCEMTLRCLASATQLVYPKDRLKMVVVDNGSTDATVSAIGQAYPDVKILPNASNLGYAGGNNVGIRYALSRSADYIGLLNNDVIVKPDMLMRLVDAAQASETTGVVTPLVAEMDAPDTVWALGSRVDWRMGNVHRLYAGDRVAALQEALTFEVDIASGAVLLAKRAVFEAIGLLDEPFFLYYEESDWCLRVRSAGYYILAVPAAMAWHKVSGTLGQSSPLIDYYMFRNHLRFVSRHWSGLRRIGMLVRIVLRDLLTIAAYTLKPRGRERLPNRDARLMALRDALLGRWGKMGQPFVVCDPVD